MGFIGLSFIGIYQVLLGFNGFYWVLLGFTGFYWVSLGFNGFYWVLSGVNGFYRVLTCFNGFYQQDSVHCRDPLQNALEADRSTSKKKGRLSACPSECTRGKVKTTIIF